MTDPRARVAVLFRAVACAMKAKDGRCGDRDQLLLLRDCVLHLEPGDAVTGAVLAFVADLPGDPRGAGARLHDAVAEAAPRAADLLERVDAALVETARHPWQERADING